MGASCARRGYFFGSAGRRAVEERLPGLREELGADVCIVNGENAADGAGITGKLADKLLASGADVVTLGNHTYRRSGIGGYLAASDRVIRPANQGALTPGNGMAVVEARNGVRVAVLNLLGQLFLDIASSIAGRYAGGPAKVSVFGSAMFGMLSGSSVANAVTVGSLTIPAA